MSQSRASAHSIAHSIAPSIPPSISPSQASRASRATHATHATQRSNASQQSAATAYVVLPPALTGAPTYQTVIGVPNSIGPASQAPPRLHSHHQVRNPDQVPLSGLITPSRQGDNPSRTQTIVSGGGGGEVQSINGDGAFSATAAGEQQGPNVSGNHVGPQGSVVFSWVMTTSMAVTAPYWYGGNPYVLYAQGSTTAGMQSPTAIWYYPDPNTGGMSFLYR